MSRHTKIATSLLVALATLALGVTPALADDVVAPAPQLPPTTEQLERIAVVAQLFGSADAALAAREVVSTIALAPVPAQSATGDVVVLSGGETPDFGTVPAVTLPPASSSRLAGPVSGPSGGLANALQACPLPGAYFSDDFGAPRSGGLRSHQGIDMGAGMGQPVYAVVDGFISWVDLVDDYVKGSDGNDRQGIALEYVSLGGDVWFIGHLSAIPDNIRRGTAVRAGDLIGLNGQTGNAQDSVPHLHIEVHPGGGPAIDPYTHLRSICR